MGKEGGRGMKERCATAICCAATVLLHCRLTSMHEGLKQATHFFPTLGRGDTKRLRAGKITLDSQRNGNQRFF